MPDIPSEAMDAAIAALRERSAVDHGSDLEKAARWHAKVALDAAAPVLAGEIARKILAHMEAHGPTPEAPGVTRHEVLRRAWRRHFGIAARIAAGTFDTREDQLRKAAEAIERGDYVACRLPEEDT